jgi:hypothetical protein
MTHITRQMAEGFSTNSENLCPLPCFVKFPSCSAVALPQVGMVRKFRELLPSTSEGRLRRVGTAATNCENVCPPTRLLAKFFGGCGCLSGMPRLPSRSKRRLVGNASKFAFMAHGFVPDACRKKFRESLPPSHCFVRFFPVLYRCCVALQSTRSPHRQRSPLYRCQRSPSQDWRYERVATMGSFSLITEAAPPPRRLVCRYRATDLQRPNVSAQGPRK